MTMRQEIEAMKQRVREMEQEALKLREMQAEAEAEQNAEGGEGDEDKEAVDSRSVYVGNVRDVARCFRLTHADAPFATG